MDILALAAALSLAITVLLVGLAIAVGGAAGTKMRSRLEGVLSGEGPAPETAAVEALRETISPLAIIQAFLSGEWLSKVENDLRMADSQLKPVDLLAIRVALAGLGFAVPVLFIGGVIGFLGAVAAAGAGFQLPQMWIKHRQTARAKKLEEQLPEALTMISNSLKAGFGLLQSLSLAADQLAHPVSTELAQTVYETNVGSSMDEAFIALSERCDSYDLDLVVTAILVQRASGGNLGEILENVAATMRERVRIRGEITTLTAQQMMTGVVIGLMPIGVGLLFLVVSPEYIAPLFTETVGKMMLGIAVVLETVGIMVIRRILAIEV